MPFESTKTPFDAVLRSVADSVSAPRRLCDAHTESPRDLTTELEPLSGCLYEKLLLHSPGL